MLPGQLLPAPMYGQPLSETPLVRCQVAGQGLACSGAPGSHTTPQTQRVKDTAGSWHPPMVHPWIGTTAPRLPPLYATASTRGAT